jgi:hypothetical protein
MKKLIINCVLCLGLWAANNALLAQSNIETILQDLDKKLVVVDAGKGKIDATIASDKKMPCAVSINVEYTDAKGKIELESYEMNLSDLSSQLLRGVTKGNVRFVEAATKDRHEYIKFKKNGEFKDYVNKFELPAFDNDAAKQIMDLLKSAIEACEKLPDACPNVKAIADASAQLKSLVTKVSIEDSQFDQQIKFDPTISTKATFTVNETVKNKSEMREFTFDFGDFTDNKVKFSISGKQLRVSIVSRAGNLVQRMENGKCKSLNDDVMFLANDIEQAKCLVKTLKTLITVSRDIADARIPAADSKGDALAMAVKQVQSFDQCAVSHKQSLTNGCVTKYAISTTTEKDKKKEDWVYELNFADINPSSVELRTSGSTIGVKLRMNESQNYIKAFKNDEQQNYDNELIIPTPDGESAKLLMNAIRKAVKNCPQVVESSCSGKGVGALDCAIAGVKEVKQAQVTVRQKLEKVPDNEFKLLLKVETEKSSKTEVLSYEWNMKDIDARRIEVKVSGKQVAVILPTKNNEKIIKVNKSEKQEYAAKVSIDVSDIETARALKQVFQKSVE